MSPPPRPVETVPGQLPPPEADLKAIFQITAALPPLLPQSLEPRGQEGAPSPLPPAAAPGPGESRREKPPGQARGPGDARLGRGTLGRALPGAPAAAGDSRDRAPAGGTAPRAEVPGGPRPGSRSLPAARRRAHRRRRFPPRSRAETMSAETASGPTEDQVEILEYNFNKVNKHPDPTTLCLIAAEAGLSEEETQKWFKQRLAQWRRSEGLPSECRSVTD